MRLVSKIDLVVKKGALPKFTSLVYEENCEIQNVSLVEQTVNGEHYVADVVYYSRDGLKGLVQRLGEQKGSFTLNSVSNPLEKQIRGGLLRISGKMSLENFHEYQTGILGAFDLISEKIGSGNGASCTGIAGNVALVCGVREKSEQREQNVYRYYAQAEIDSIVLGRFTGLSGFPVVIQYGLDEDLIRTIQRIERTYAMVRMVAIDEGERSVYDQLVSGLNVPVVVRDMDDVPLYMLTLIQKVMQKSRQAPTEATIGFVGINPAVLRITGLLKKLGCMRVLGFDHNEKLLLSFENEDGMATTVENIFSNADIVILSKDIFDREELARVRPGQFFISLFKDERMPVKRLFEKGVKEFITVDPMSFAVLGPGLVKGLLASGRRNLDDYALIDLAGKLLPHVTPAYEFPGLFSDIHDTIRGYLSNDEAAPAGDKS